GGSGGGVGEEDGEDGEEGEELELGIWLWVVTRKSSSKIGVDGVTVSDAGISSEVE
ncbi:hypothetical protein L195_g033341, partial [Trifolium pratense]